jgi:hypothetical protein
VKILKIVTAVAVLLSIASTAAGLTWLKKHPKLGQPGIKAEAIPGDRVMKIELPADVLNYASTNLPTSEEVLRYLPKDTSYAQRAYMAPDKFWVKANIILMGADRTSIHKPDYCLAGHGLNVLSKSTAMIPVAGPTPYELPVSKWIGRQIVDNGNGKKTEIRGVYVFWFVADNEHTPDYAERKRWIMRDLLLTGVLQRWAYVSYLSVCRPGEEEACFERMKSLIGASVSSFQPPPRTADGARVAAH